MRTLATMVSYLYDLTSVQKAPIYNKMKPDN